MLILFELISYFCDFVGKTKHILLNRMIITNLFKKTILSLFLCAQL